MKKRIIATVCGLVMMASLLTGCGGKTATDEMTGSSIETADAEAEVETEAEAETETEVNEASTDISEDEDILDDFAIPEYETDVTIRIGGLKGPTSIGLLNLKNRAMAGEAGQNYEFTMATAADEITTALVKGELDIALIPANVASVLYNKTEGQITVIDINTLGVLYMVSGDTSVSSPEDLRGKTVYLTGKGTTPDYVLQYILGQNGVLEDVTLEYKSEATEVAAVLAEDETAIGLLPQPFVTVATTKNENLSVIMDMTAEWDKVQGENGSRLLTGVTVVRNDFLNDHPVAVDAFLYDHKESIAETMDNLNEVADYAVEEEIIASSQIAMKAIPECNITYIDGNDMKQALAGYLEVLYELDPKSVGGALPGDDFYLVK